MSTEPFLHRSGFIEGRKISNYGRDVDFRFTQRSEEVDELAKVARTLAPATRDEVCDLLVQSLNFSVQDSDGPDGLARFAEAKNLIYRAASARRSNLFGKMLAKTVLLFAIGVLLYFIWNCAAEYGWWNVLDEPNDVRLNYVFAFLGALGVFIVGFSLTWGFLGIHKIRAADAETVMSDKYLTRSTHYEVGYAVALCFISLTAILIGVAGFGETPQPHELPLAERWLSVGFVVGLAEKSILDRLG